MKIINFAETRKRMHKFYVENIKENMTKMKRKNASQ